MSLPTVVMVLQTPDRFSSSICWLRPLRECFLSFGLSGARPLDAPIYILYIAKYLLLPYQRIAPWIRTHAVQLVAKPASAKVSVQLPVCFRLFRAIMRNHSFILTHRQQVSSCAARGCRASPPSRHISLILPWSTHSLHR